MELVELLKLLKVHGVFVKYEAISGLIIIIIIVISKSFNII